MKPGREKVEREGECRSCGAPARVCDAAHLWNRSQGSKGFEDADLVIPLCSSLKRGTGHGCHQLYDAHRLDVLPLLTLEEQVALVRAAGGIERARARAIGDGSSAPTFRRAGDGPF